MSNRILIRKNKVSYASPPLIIGRGSMGMVYRATYQGKTVVVKKSQRDIDILLKEYSNYIKLQKHNNILKFYGVIRDDRYAYSLVLEFAANGDLSSYLKTHTVSWEWKARICRDVALALMHCHDNNVLHFDLKPENILLSEGLVPKLADFSISKTKSQMALDHNKAGGTLNYVAPERVCWDLKMREFFENHPKLSDIYSFGLILWSVAKDGEHPHEGLDDDEIKEQKRSPHSSYRLLTQLPPMTPTAYSQLILDLTKYNPSERLELTIARLELEDMYDDDDYANQGFHDNESLGLDFDSDGDSSTHGTDSELKSVDVYISSSKSTSTSTSVESESSECSIGHERRFSLPVAKKTRDVTTRAASNPASRPASSASNSSGNAGQSNLQLQVHNMGSIRVEIPRTGTPHIDPDHESPGSLVDGRSQTTLVGSPPVGSPCVGSPLSPRTPPFEKAVKKLLDDNDRLIDDLLYIFLDWESVTDDVMSRRIDHMCVQRGIRSSDLLQILTSEPEATRSAEIYFAIGFCNEHGIGKKRDLEQAYMNYFSAVELGDVRSEIYLGWCYYKGMGVEKDPQRAFACFQSAAVKGYKSAQNNLGWCYDIGFGTTCDPYRAFECFKMSAEKGYATAQCRVGVCYEYGRGTIKDLEKALEWYNKAAESGHEIAKKRVSELAKVIGRSRHHRRNFFGSIWPSKVAYNSIKHRRFLFVE